MTSPTSARSLLSLSSLADDCSSNFLTCRSTSGLAKRRSSSSHSGKRFSHSTHRISGFVGKLAQAQASVDQGLMHGEQHVLFFLGRETLQGGGIAEIAAEHALFRNASALVRVGAQRLDQRLRINIHPLRLEQHPTTEFQIPQHAGAGKQGQNRLELVVRKAGLVSG